jgi:micrococcal nuclease
MAKRKTTRRAQVDQAWLAQAHHAGQARFRPAEARRSGISSAALVYALCLGLMIGYFAPDWAKRVHWPAVPTTPVAAPSADLPLPDPLSADFTFCHRGGGTNCVVDGDTFWFAGEKYRIADIDTPETHRPRCAQEGALGAQATDRLQALMNAGPFTLETEGRDTDRYGRKLRVVTREGQSIGAMLVAEGLARTWDGSRHPWC